MLFVSFVQSLISVEKNRLSEPPGGGLRTSTAVGAFMVLREDDRCKIYMKKFAISSRANEDYLNQTRMNPPPGSPPAPVHGVNIILGGAMLSGIILAIFILCYCCHKTNRKSSPSLSSMIWRDPGMSLQIYTVEAAQNRLVEMEDADREVPRCPTPGPPPPYDTVIMTSDPKQTEVKSPDSSGLPSYEVAVRNLRTSSPIHWTQYT